MPEPNAVSLSQGRAATRPARIDRYELRGVLGKGGMGSVYLARDSLLGRDVALKVVHDELVASAKGAALDRLVALFQQEARHLAGLNHPGIVQIFDYSGLYSPQLYLVMEFVPGRPLSALVRHGGPLPIAEAVAVGVAVAGVLEYAHRLGVLHLDLKPDNVLVTSDGRLKLTDFGISRRLSPSGEASRLQVERAGGVVAGTPAYMAPEQAAGRSAGPRADVFSLAATVYRLLTGHPLASGTSAVDTIARLARGDFPRAREHRPELPEAIDEVLARALVPAPDARTAGALTLGRELAEASGLAPPDPEAIPKVAALGARVSGLPAPRQELLEGPLRTSPETLARQSVEARRRVAATADVRRRPSKPGDEDRHASPPRGARTVTPPPRPVATARAPTAAPTSPASTRSAAPTETVLPAGVEAHDHPGRGPTGVSLTGLAATALGDPSNAPTALRGAAGRTLAGDRRHAPPRVGGAVVLEGRYTLLEKLGAGPLGEVWRAGDGAHGGAPVAVKIIAPTRGASLDEFKSAFRELAGVDHRNLVRIGDFGLTEAPSDRRPLAYYTMELIEGPTLTDAAVDAPFAQRVAWLVDVARGLDALHAHTGRPHLGLKPANVLVASGDADGASRAVVLDPGNPTEKLRSIHRGDRGALPYAAPETLTGFGAGLPADLYAFGALAFEVLTGARPLEGRTATLLRSAHLEAPARRLDELLTDAPSALVDVVARCLSKVPSERPARPMAFVDAVNQFTVPPFPVVAATTPRALASGQLVGRDEELQALLAGFRDVAIAGPPRQDPDGLHAPALPSPMALLVGSAGVGKAHLCATLRRDLQLQGARVVEGGPAGDTARVLGPWAPILRDRLARLGRHHPALRGIRERLERLVERGEAEAGLNALAPTAPPAPAPPAPAPPGYEVPAPIPAEALAATLVAGVTRPTAWLLRDVSRWDDASAAVLAAVLQRLRAPPALPGPADAAPRSMARDDGARVPLFLVGTARHEAGDPEPAVATWPGVWTLHLDGLDLDGTRTLLAMALGMDGEAPGGPLSDDAVAELHRVTGGRPGDVQDVLRVMVEAGDLEASPGGWRVRPGAAIPLPPSVEEALSRRVAHLDPAERDLLEALAVHEGPVPVRRIDALGGDAAAALSRLEGRDMLAREMVRDEVSLRFRHTRLRDTVLLGMPESVREQRHCAAAAWIEASGPVEAAVDALAFHWGRGGRPDRALSFLLEAAERASEAGAQDRAVARYREALARLPELGLGLLRRVRTEARVLEPLAEAERASGRLEAAERHHQRLLAHAKDLDDGAMAGRAMDGLGLTALDAGRPAEARRWAEQRLDLAERAQDRRGQALALRLLGAAARHTDGATAGLGPLRRALAITAGDADLADVRARVALSLSFGLSTTGDPAEGLAWAEWGRQAARSMGLDVVEVSCLVNASMATFLMGQPERTLALAREAEAFARERGLARQATLALGNAGDALRVLGRFDDAEDALRRALRETYRVGSSDRVLARLVELATLGLGQGRPERAAPYLAEAWRVDAKVATVRPKLALRLAELRARTAKPATRAGGGSEAALLREVSGWTTPDGGPPSPDGVWALALAARATLTKAGARAAKRSAMEAARMAAALPAPGLGQHPGLAVDLEATLRALGEVAAAERLVALARAAVEARLADLTDPTLAAAYRAVPAVDALLAAQ